MDMLRPGINGLDQAQVWTNMSRQAPFRTQHRMKVAEANTGKHQMPMKEELYYDIL